MPHSTRSSRPPVGRAPATRPASSSLEPRIFLGLILAALFLTSLPYWLGYAFKPDGFAFVGTAYNIDDYCNYLSWLRQTMDGHFFLRSLFTTDPQGGREFNVFFWVLGRLAHLIHLSPQAILQVARVGGGVALLSLIYRFYRLCLPDNIPARLTAFGFACLGSGFGWVSWAHWRDKNLPGSPVDAWQPEAFTFLSLYTSALFTVSTALIVGALYALLRGEQTGKWRYPVIAGLCGAILGNMHSYDVLHLAAAWGLFLVVWTVQRRGVSVAGTWGRAILALGLTMPTTLYQYFLLKQDAVFSKRAAVPTLSPPLWHYVLGYGLVFLLAVVGLLFSRQLLRARRNRDGGAEGTRPLSMRPNPLLFASCWAVAGLAVIYLPFAFQRKMLMGEHVPLCLLAGVGAAALVKRLPGRRQTIVLALLVLASMPSNLLFLSRDIDHLEVNRSETSQFPYLSATLVDVYHWTSANTAPGAAIVGPPVLCAYLPGYTGHAVWAGHWGETPDYAGKLSQFLRFSDSQTTDQERQSFLRSTRAQYLFFPNDVSTGYVTKSGEARQFTDFAHSPPPYLKPVHTNKDYTVFQIDLAGARG
jgi:hypothetical protein